MAVTYTQDDDVIFEKRDSDDLVDYVVLKVIGVEGTDSNPKTNTAWLGVRVALGTPTAEGSVTKAQIDTAFATAKTTVPADETDDVETLIASAISGQSAGPDCVDISYDSLS